MRLIRESIDLLIQNHRLPEDLDDLLSQMMSSDRTTFDVQESSLWDYKEHFPFSHSDEYFGGIVRLICAFFNTYGGIIIFGVDDKSRAIVRSPVKVNIERLNSVLREVLTAPIECVHRSYSLPAEKGSTTTSQVDVLLVPKRVRCPLRSGPS